MNKLKDWNSIFSGPNRKKNSLLLVWKKLGEGGMARMDTERFDDRSGSRGDSAPI